MCSVPESARNFATAEKLIAEAAVQGARWIALPENFNSMARRDDRYRLADSIDDSEARTFLAARAKRHRIYLSAGVFVQSKKIDRLFNRCLVFSPDGEEVAMYQKNHLFDVDLDANDQHSESSYCIAGDRPVTVDCDWGCVGLSICYDLRFPEYYRLLADAGATMILAPSAFTCPTGEAHWEILIRSRAIENQVFLLAPAQWGTHENGRLTYGDSMIVDPWGKILVRRRQGTGVILASLDFDKLRAIRKKLPALEHRRYPVNVQPADKTEIPN